MHRAQLIEQPEHQPDDRLDLLIGIQGHLAGGPAGIPGRQRDRQLPAAGLGQPPRRHPLPDQMQLEFRHRALQPEQEAVVIPVRIVDPVRVGQQRPGQRAQLDQLMPVPARAGQPRHLQAQHQPHMPHRELRDQPREPRPLGRVRRRPPQVLIDHHHPGGRPAQRGRPLGQPVLQPGRLAVIQDLLARRLPDVDGRQPVTMPALDLAIAVLTRQHRAHPRPPPPPARPRPPTAPRACPAIPECRSGSPPETTSTAPPPKPSSPPSSGEDARVRAVPDAPPPSGSRARSRPAHSTSRSRPSLPITGVLTAACPTLHALWRTD